MAGTDKQEFPNLLAPGFHPMPLNRVRELCVSAFPSSKRRPLIMDGLERVTAEIVRHDIVSKIWIDGSFLTEKIEPDDVDVVVEIELTFRQQATQKQKDVINWILSDLKPSHYCHSFLLEVYPSGHPKAHLNKQNRDDWMHVFGFSRQGQPKGIAVVQTP
ncbi:MAG: hypothetical protein M2R45_04148 [Verrucomicrobia subdivision 3 bacterium]|nr:hypothetical protein [Limisphaerales bacterium]MCS1417713.1 hypothetical protein [Limisphaerales bacterium]